MLVSNTTLQLRTLSLKSSTGNGNYVRPLLTLSMHTHLIPQHQVTDQQKKHTGRGLRPQVIELNWLKALTGILPEYASLLLPLTQSTEAASPCGLQCISIPTPACWGWQCSGTLSCLSCPLLGIQQGHKAPLELVGPCHTTACEEVMAGDSWAPGRETCSI